jgi:hypothetical protein
MVASPELALVVTQAERELELEPAPWTLAHQTMTTLPFAHLRVPGLRPVQQRVLPRRRARSFRRSCGRTRHRQRRRATPPLPNRRPRV